MLINQELFDTVEQALSKNGTIDDFENENGKITGRMMITLTDIPEDIEIEKNKKSIYAFACSFDFYDVSIGIVLDTKELKVLSPIWATEQIPNAEQPDRVWIDFFLKTHTKKQILTVIAEGEPVDVLPEILKTDEIEITNEDGSKETTTIHILY